MPSIQIDSEKCPAAIFAVLSLANYSDQSFRMAARGGNGSGPYAQLLIILVHVRQDSCCDHDRGSGCRSRIMKIFELEILSDIANSRMLGGAY